MGGDFAGCPGAQTAQTAQTIHSRPQTPTTLIRRHTLAAADNKRLAQLCGPLDANLRAIEAALGVGLSRRDASFRVNGAAEAVERTINLLDQLYDKARVPLTERSLQLVLAGALQPVQTGDDPAGLDDEPIVLHTRHSELAGRTPGQVQYLRQMLARDITFGIGPAGTGKTFLAVACAVDALERKGVQRIVLTRPAVEAGERLGFLPGDLAQKIDPYLRPLYDALNDLMGADRVVKAIEKQQIEIAPLAFMRGRTLNHAFIILDEAQNTTREQMKMFLTRIGFGSRCVVTGDPSQTDLPAGQPSGLADAEQVLAGVSGIAFTRFTAADVVRHPLVARIVQAYDDDRAQRGGM